MINNGCNWKLREVDALRDRLLRATTATQLTARQNEILLFIASSDADGTADFTNTISVASAFGDTKFCNYDVAKCMFGYCGI